MRGGCHTLRTSCAYLDFRFIQSLCSVVRSEYPDWSALPNLPPKNLTVAATGASGAIFLRHFLATFSATFASRP